MRSVRVQLQFLLIPVATGFWYFSSSINAVASQKLFRGLIDKDAGGEDQDEPQQSSGVILLSVVLTLLQLCMGGILSLAVLVGFGDANSTATSSSSKSATTTSSNNHNPQRTPAPIRQLVAQLRQPRDVWIGLLHCIGSICTNIGYGYGSASLVQVIKLLEPIETLVLAALVQRSMQVLSFQKVTSTITIIAGTYMLLANPSIDVPPKSVFFAILSGLCMASRNVLSKQKRTQTPDDQASTTTNNNNNTVRAILLKGMTKFATITCMSCLWALGLGMVVGLWERSALWGLIPRLVEVAPHTILLQTILFHCLYNMASITVLSLTSATSHSLLNVGKRIANVMIASMAFSIPLTLEGKIGLVVAAIGACFYNDRIAQALGERLQRFTTRTSTKSVRHRTWSIVTFAFVLVAATSQFRLQLQYHQFDAVGRSASAGGETDGSLRGHKYDADSLISAPHRQQQHVQRQRPQHTVLVSSNYTRHNKVVLLGPHDRYNFGDLLFSKVLAKLLTTRGGYREDEIVYGGIVSVNMSAYAGPSTVLSMKQVQRLSRTDPRQGPYDIISCGGEALGCTHECAVNMMPTPELVAQAQHEKIHECGYLLPKRLLQKPPKSIFSIEYWRSRDDDDNDYHKKNSPNYAVINSLGGASVAQPCQEAVQTADYAAYRDNDPLYPDSAVMTKELFSQEIAQGAKDVWKDLGFGVLDEDEEHTNKKRRVIAVQHRQIDDASTAAQLASALDVVATQHNATIVFFAAGTAPSHDSFESYHQVAQLMSQKAIVCEEEHVWKVVGLISQSVAVLSTSLHVRIMAFIHFKPRVTWCEAGAKHAHFIDLWDTGTSARCLEELTETADVLQKLYFGTTAAAAQEATEMKYQELVLRYMSSFHQYSRLLRPKAEDSIQRVHPRDDVP